MTTPVYPHPTIDVPVAVFGECPNLRARQVVGESMTGDDIQDGDYGLIDPDRVAHDGDICAVHVTDWTCTDGVVRSGWLIKRLADNGMTLLSSNPANPPMRLESRHRPVVEGVVIGLARHFGKEMQIIGMGTAVGLVRRFT